MRSFGESCRSWKINSICSIRNPIIGDIRSRDSNVYRTEKQQEVESTVRAKLASEVCHSSPTNHGSNKVREEDYKLIL